MDWSEWHPHGTVALDWLPHDIGIALALHWHYIVIALSLHWHCIGIALALHWLPLDYHSSCDFDTANCSTIETGSHESSEPEWHRKMSEWHSSGRVAMNWQSGSPMV